MRLLSTLKLVLLPLGMVVLGTAAVFVSLADDPVAVKGPDTVGSPTSFRGDSSMLAAEAAISNFVVNESGSDNVYQQQVVSGWATKDLLYVVSGQQSEQIGGLTAINANLSELVATQGDLIAAVAEPDPIDDRPRQLLALVVLAVGWFGLWFPVPARTPRRRGEVIESAATPTLPELPTPAGETPPAG